MTTIIDSAVEGPKSSPDALLKAAVSGAKAAGDKTAPAVPMAAKPSRRFDAMTMGFAGAALALGIVLGAGSAIFATPRSEGTGIVLAEINAALEANRLEASRLAIASDRLDKSVAALKEVSETARSEAKMRSTALTEKVGKSETALVAKFAALGERIDQAEKEQAAASQRRPRRPRSARSRQRPRRCRRPRHSLFRPGASPSRSQSPRSSPHGRCATCTTAPPCWRIGVDDSLRSWSATRSQASGGSKRSNGAGGNGSW